MAEGWQEADKGKLGQLVREEAAEVGGIRTRGTPQAAVGV